MYRIKERAGGLVRTTQVGQGFLITDKQGNKLEIILSECKVLNSKIVLRGSKELKIDFIQVPRERVGDES